MSFIRLLNKIPDKVCIALSGGLDSMVCLDFLLKGGKDVIALHYNHNTDSADLYQGFVERKCKEFGVRLKVSKLNCDIPKGRSKEDFWREQRYSFFDKEREGRSLITCHHLDDVVETWVFSSLKGSSRLIPYSRNYIIRPFLLNKKSILLEWSNRNNVEYIQDETNFNCDFDRNFIRNKMMKDVLHINPGIHKVLKKKLVNKWKGYDV